MTDKSNLSSLASTFSSLHRPGDPIILANVYDTLSASTVAALPSCKAIATASYGVAQAAGLADDDLTLEVNLAAAKAVGRVAREHGKPMTVDLQDGYGDRLEEAVKGVIDAGGVGINLEDYSRDKGEMWSLNEAAERVKKVLEVATGEGVDGFVVNARCDGFLYGKDIEEVVRRGKAHLEAGATTVFVWGGRKRGGISREEVERLSKEFGGRLNVSLKWEDGLTVKELRGIGVARISVGPAIQLFVVEEVRRRAEDLLSR